MVAEFREDPPDEWVHTSAHLQQMPSVRNGDCIRTAVNPMFTCRHRMAKEPAWKKQRRLSMWDRNERVSRGKLTCACVRGVS